MPQYDTFHVFYLLGWEDIQTPYMGDGCNNLQNPGTFLFKHAWVPPPYRVRDRLALQNTPTSGTRCLDDVLNIYISFFSHRKNPFFIYVTHPLELTSVGMLHPVLVALLVQTINVSDICPDRSGSFRKYRPKISRYSPLGFVVYFVSQQFSQVVELRKMKQKYRFFFSF